MRQPAAILTIDQRARSVQLVLVTYLIGTAAGARLLTGRARGYAIVALALTVLVAPFAATYSIVPVLVAATALLYRWAKDRAGAGLDESEPTT